MKKTLIIFLILVSTFSYAGDGGLEKAMKLSESNISCQQYSIKLVDLLSTNPLDLGSIEIVRDLYHGCIESLASMIDNAPASAELLVEELYSKRMICDLEIRKIENLLSSSSEDLDFETIILAKKTLNECVEKAKDILTH